MKKCPYCEVKKKLKKFRTHGNFFSRCDHCKQYERLIIEKKRMEIGLPGKPDYFRLLCE